MEHKNHSFRRRLGYALSGIGRTARREKSFRTQAALGAMAAITAAWLRPAPVWIALLAVASSLVLALEMVNAALEEALDRIHPEWNPSIGAAKDAAAGAVLIASLGAAAVMAAMLYACVLS